MLYHSFNDILTTMFGAIFFTALWNVYYIYTNYITTPQIQSSDVVIKKNVKLTGNVFAVIFNLAILWLFLFNYVHIQKFSTSLIFWDTLQLSNNTANFFFLSISILMVIMTSISCLSKQNISFSIEYALFVYIIILAGYLLISSTNLFITVFFLEFIALLIFGKFTVSRVLFNTSKLMSNNPAYMSQHSYGLFNSLFFQFWANFVSSILLFFSLINIHYLCGTSNFFILNFIFSILSSNLFIPNNFNMTIFILFTMGLFIKLGLSPYQFFKIETYKGVPLFMVVIYTTLYLLIYVYFFLFLFFYQLPVIRDFTGAYTLFSITFSLFYLISLLFDTKNFKAFLSYSTLITVVNLFVVVLVL